MRKRRRCRGIISPGFFRSPVAIYSDTNGEARETCVGVQGRRIVPALDLKVASWVPELADAPLLCGLYFVEFGSAIRR
ncbi:hypothetical protein HU200_043295 [Digitaria exilis]|uniref:Uncharacterized protein n=1 Tax=Digitaria exilis TaxID=1010633 RepID=A0A835B3Q3_9POAL|nr:hypothetical protein HU200_043295 [Digitaria exilis]